jgi:hypothetical protein
MSVNEQARSLMNRHNHLIRNRQQSLRTRTAAEVGLPIDTVRGTDYVQGKSSHDNIMAYEPSHAALS